MFDGRYKVLDILSPCNEGKYSTVQYSSVQYSTVLYEAGRWVLLHGEEVGPGGGVGGRPPDQDQGVPLAQPDGQG